MAAQLATFTPLPLVESFTGKPAGGSIFPRNRVNFNIRGGAVPAKIATDSLTIEVICNLPESFGYTLDYFNIFINGGVGEMVQWENNGVVIFNPDTPGDGLATPFQMQVFSEGVTPNLQVSNEIKIWRPEGIFKNLLFNRTATEPSATVRINNTTVDTSSAAASFGIRFSFLAFDIDQIDDVSVNTPAPVRVI